MNIYDLLTPLSLSYWICADGGFCKRNRAIILSTQGFSLQEVELLVKVLTETFHLKCFASAVGGMQNSYFFMGLRSLKKIGALSIKIGKPL